MASSRSISANRPCRNPDLVNLSARPLGANRAVCSVGAKSGPTVANAATAYGTDGTSTARQM